MKQLTEAKVKKTDLVIWHRIVRAYMLKRVLVLNVKEPWFTYMQKGVKDIECRKDSQWINMRLFNKDGSDREYDYILIMNGMKKQTPFFVAKYNGFGTGYDNTYTFTGGETLTVKPENYVLFLGKVLLSVNLKPNKNYEQTQQGPND